MPTRQHPYLANIADSPWNMLNYEVFLSLPTEQNLKKAWISPRSPFHGSMGSTTQKGVGNRLRLSGVGSSPGPRVLQSLVHPMAPVRGDWCTVLNFNLMSITLTRNKYLLLTGGSNMSCWHMRLDWTNLGLVFEQKRQNKQKHRGTVVLYLGLAVCYWLLLMAKILHHLRRTLQINNMGIQLLPVICCWPDFSHLK